MGVSQFSDPFYAPAPTPSSGSRHWALFKRYFGYTLVGHQTIDSRAETRTAAVCRAWHSIWSIAFIGNDEALAQEWLGHEDPTKPFRDVLFLTKEALAKLGLVDPPDLPKLEYRNYRQLCWAKHANPILETRWAVEVQGGIVTRTMGPNTSPLTVRLAWFALEHAAGYAYIAMASLTRSHLVDTMPEELGHAVREIALRRKELNSMAKARWPQEDPFPGRW